jgi:UDP-N-acetylmuramoylalanine-D-glutamate ligase
MTNLTKLLASLVLVLGLVATGNAASVISETDGFKVYQSDTTDGEEKKKKEGEEEEPDC